MRRYSRVTLAACCLALLGCPKNDTASTDGPVDPCATDTECVEGHRECTAVGTAAKCGKCLSGYAEKDGECVTGVTTCPGDQVECTGTCTDLLTNSANCGSCGHRCQTLERCQNGTCIVDCGTGLQKCGNQCFDLTHDNSHCGTCETVCPSGRECRSGVCSCPTDLTDCSGTCVNTKTDPQNCVTCGNHCVVNEACSTTGCVTSCSWPLTNCSGSCVNLQSDSTHCGDCPTVCGSLPHATSGCSGGQCVVASCSLGYAHCDSNTSNGCELGLGHTGACESPDDAGSNCGDDQTGGLTGCVGPVSYPLSDVTRVGSAWLHYLITECNWCSSPMTFTAALDVPQGVDYDLYLWSYYVDEYGGVCSGVLTQSTGANAREVLVYKWPDNAGGTDIRQFVVEVRYAQGSSCLPWVLHAGGGTWTAP
jgi:hypothetical protein